ncbi:MAG: CHAT domain-containing tetratricopeptide repeat protein [Chitinophagales bacterium]
MSILYFEIGTFSQNRNCIASAIEEAHRVGLYEEHPIFGKIYWQQAQLFYTEEKWNDAAYFFNKACSIFACEQDWEDYAWVKFVIGTMAYYVGDFSKMECALNESLMIGETLKEDKVSLMTNILYTLGVFYELKGDYNRALEISQKALLMQANSTDSTTIGTLYNNIGAIFYAKCDYEQAISFFQQSILIFQKIRGEQSLDCAEIYANIGLAHLYQKEFDEALQYFYKSLEITHSGLNSNEIENTIICYNNLSKTHFDLGKYDTSFYFAQKSFEINQDNQGYIDVTYDQLSAVYKERKEYQKALRLNEDALRIRKDKYGERHKETADSYRRIAEIYYELNQVDIALAYCQKALIAVSLDFNSEDIYTNPSLNNVNDRNSITEILELKGTLLTLSFQKEKKQIDLLKGALDSFELAISAMDSMRRDFQADASKHTLAAKALPIYEKSIQTAIELSDWFGKNGVDSVQVTNQYLQKAFQFAEKNKAAILLEAIKESKALLFSNIPTTILKREEDLKRDMEFYERKLFEKKQKSKDNADSLKMSFWESKIFDLSQEYQGLIDTLERDFPDYYHLKYNIEVASIEELQTKLKDKDETLLEYFVGKQNVYVFVINANSIEVRKTPNDIVLQQHFETLVQSLKLNPFQTADVKEAYLAYLQSAHWIYQYLVKDMLPEKNLTNQIKSLTVIPDGIMGYIPFEALLVQYPNNVEKIDFSLANLDYLIEEYSLSYAYSATLLLEGLEESSKSVAKGSYIGFAPVFEKQVKSDTTKSYGSCLTTELETLAESELEVKRLGDMMNGKVFLKEEATKQNFMKNRANGRILHLATHACLSQADPMFSTIHFVDDYLSTYELFNIRLDVDLAILSACNTGSGTYIPGEGIMSLSKGFLYAGCPSIITSLWSVNDKASAEIMLNLHVNLLEGQSKNDALRSAKLQYLETEPNRLLPPYFWATFVHIGNPKPIELDSVSFLTFGWIIGISFFIFCFLYLVSRNRTMF